jgi:hypothetical protein
MDGRRQGLLVHRLISRRHTVEEQKRSDSPFALFLRSRETF